MKNIIIFTHVNYAKSINPFFWLKVFLFETCISFQVIGWSYNKYTIINIMVPFWKKNNLLRWKIWILGSYQDNWKLQSLNPSEPYFLNP